MIEEIVTGEGVLAIGKEEENTIRRREATKRETHCILRTRIHRSRNSHQLRMGTYFRIKKRIN